MAKILALLPSPTFPEDVQTEYLTKYLTDDVFRRRKLRLTFIGIRLIEIMGESLFNKIIWDSLAFNIGDQPLTRSANTMITWHKPDLILVFSDFEKASIQFLVDMGKIQCEVIDCLLLNILGSKTLSSLEILNQVKTKIVDLERKRI